MTKTRVALLILAGCGLILPLPLDAAAAPQGASAKAAQALAADTPSTTVAGHTFIAPAGWSLSVKGKATIVEAPEGDSRIVFVDVAAMEPDAAIQEAWAAYRPDANWPLKVEDGLFRQGRLDPPADLLLPDLAERARARSPRGRRATATSSWCGSTTWRMPSAEKRGAQVALIFGRLFPKGYTRETFAGRKANTLDAARIAELGAFIERGQSQLGVPGVSLGIVQGGKVVFAGGFGVRELGEAGEGRRRHALHHRLEHEGDDDAAARQAGRPEEAHVGDAGHEAAAAFKLGDADTTSKVLVEHLICACTGLPRQDFEWLFEFGKATPESALATLGTMQPTSKFGEMFQYSNPLAAAAGYVGGARAVPRAGARGRVRPGDADARSSARSA